MVPLPGGSEGNDREVAEALQRSTSPFEPGLSDTGGVCRSGDTTSAPRCNGPGRCGIWGLRAPPRCITAPSGATARRSRSLTLAAVRRIRAGQDQLHEIYLAFVDFAMVSRLKDCNHHPPGWIGVNRSGFAGGSTA